MMFPRVRYAGLGSRMMAWLIDCAIVFFLSVAFVAFLDVVSIISLSNMDIRVFCIILLVTFWGLGMLYGTGAGYLSKGQTFGKFLWGIATVGENLKYASSKSLFIDTVLKFSPLLIVDVIAGMIKHPSDSRLRIRLFQSISKTVVVKVR